MTLTLGNSGDGARWAAKQVTCSNTRAGSLSMNLDEGIRKYSLRIMWKHGKALHEQRLAQLSRVAFWQSA